MATKMLVLALCAVAVMGGALPEAARYPAGVDPNICPNYPNCDNVALAARTVAMASSHYPSPSHYSAPSHYSSPSHYSAPAPYAAPAYSAYGHQSGAGVPRAAAGYPAGVDANICPNYPYCGPTPAHAPAAPAYNSWNAPAPQNNHAAQGSLSNLGGPNFWSNPAANSFANAPSQSSWNAGRSSWQAPAQSADQGGALFPAGVDPSSCPNYPYCH